MRTRAAAKAFILLGLCFCYAACTPGKSRPEEPALEAGKPVFSFSPEEVEELSIEKNDAASGDRWSVTLQPMPTDHSEPGWKIASAGTRDLIDRHADAAFVLHLLDTLRTLTYSQPAPPGDDRSYGLDPPLFGLRWKTRAARHELWLGSANPQGQDSHDAGSRYARVGSLQSPRTIIVQGAAIQMLNMVAGMEILRRRVVLTIPGDDVDEFTFITGSRKFYAQRQGDGWADAKEKQLPDAIDSRFQDLVHLRVREFIDSREKAVSLRKRVEARPSYEAVLKDRAGRPTSIKVAVIDQHWVATESGRADAVFLLHPEARRIFEALSKGAAR